MPRKRPKPQSDETGGTIRISSGELRGRLIECPQTGGVRPMLSRTRMALFNLIRDRLQGATVWDCFAGSGLLGFEALSQGAEYCVFVESDTAHARIVQANLGALGLGSKGNLIRGSVFGLVKAGIPRLPHTPAGVVLLDPPHAMFADRDSEFWPWLHALRETPLIDDQSTIAIGHPAELSVDADGWLKIADSRTYGTVAFTLLTLGAL